MSTIRRQSIISSAIVYFGFALGFLNTYLFVREGGFTKAEYGLTGLFISIANVMYAMAGLGMHGYIYKFFPYYKDNLKPKENDMMTWAIGTSLVGFLIVMSGGLIFKDLVIRKYGTHSPQFITYYYWIFPFGFGLTIYSLLEAYAWQLRKSILTNYLREVQFRLFTTLLIVLSFYGVIKNFDLFIKLFALSYLLLALVLLIILLQKKSISFPLSKSKITRRFSRKIILLASFIGGGNIVMTVSLMFDTMVIAAVVPDGLAFAGIYTLAQNIASLIQAPQRGIITSSVGALSRSWKEKDLTKIQRIYRSSSINQIIFSVGMFLLIWLNFVDAVFTFNLQKDYLLAQNVFFFIGLMRIIDMGTGVNAQIIGTSTFWRFEFITGIILLGITLPLNYLLTKSLQEIGPAIANLIAYTIYNCIRYVFLYRKFNLQPFTIKSIYPFLLGLIAYYTCYFLFKDKQGILWMFIRSTLFLSIYLTGVVIMKVSPDIQPVWNTLLKKIGFRK